MNQGRITAYLPSLISDFNRIGLSRRPGVTQLQVARLNTSYIADTKQLFSELRNIVMKRTNPSTLRVTVRGANGSFIRKTMIWLDNDIIELKMKVDFFQFAMEVGREVILCLCRLPIVYIVLRF